MEGRYLVVGFAAGDIPKSSKFSFAKGCQIVGVFWGAFKMREFEAHTANVAELLKL